MERRFGGGIGCRVAPSRVFSTPSAPLLPFAIFQSVRLACSIDADPRCLLPGVVSAELASTSPLKDASFCPDPQRSGCYATASAPRERRHKANLSSKPLSQLTAAQLAQFAQLRGMLGRLGCPQRTQSNEHCKIDGDCTQAGSCHHRQRCSITARDVPTDAGELSCSSSSLLVEACAKSCPRRQGLVDELYVMSRAIAVPHFAMPLSSGVVLESEGESFIGVNHAFHKRVNPPGSTLRGILKGCAEQNVLGAAAASGAAYRDIAEVFLLAVRLIPRSTVEPDSAASAFSKGGLHTNSAGRLVPQTAMVFPCPECWRHLCHVARARHDHGRSPLQLFVFADSPSEAVDLFALAQKRREVLDEPMEICVVTEFATSV